MKTKKIRRLTCLLVCTICLAFVFLFANNIDTVSGRADTTLNGWEEEVVYNVNDNLVVPDDITINVDGNTVEYTSVVVIYPDGSVKELSNCNLDTVGTYTVRFYGVHGGKTVTAEKSFLVKQKIYETSGASSIVSFKTKDEIKNSNLMGSNAADGIDVHLQTGEYFRFNKTVNIYEVAAENEGVADFITVYPGFSITQATYFTVKLIDAYDESNFLEFYVNLVEGTYYCGAGSSNQTMIGFSQDWSPTVTLESGVGVAPWKVSRIYPDKGYGTYRLNEYNLYAGGGIKFSYNPTTNEVFEGGILINDVDDKNLYPENPFSGFTTGEVYVQVEFVKPQVDFIDVQITKLFNFVGEDLENGWVEDTSAPKVDIDVDYTYDKTVKLAKGREYLLPDATVYDLNSNGKYKRSVYSNYYTDNPMVVNVVNGKFTPTLTGLYTAVYYAEDFFGNSNTGSDGKCVDIINFDVVDEAPFTIEENKITSLIACRDNTIPQLNIQSINKGLTVKVSVIDNMGNEEDITNNTVSGGYSYMPQRVGDHIIKYTLKDNVYSEEYSYKVSCVDNGDIFFKDQLHIPSVMIKGATYDLDTYYAYALSSEGQLAATIADIYVSEDEKEFIKIENTKAFTVNASTSIAFYAKLNDKTSPIVTSKVTDVNYVENSNVNNGKKLYQNYFVGYKSVELASRSFNYLLDESNKFISYATPITLGAFSLEFTLPTYINEEATIANSNFSVLQINLRALGDRANSGYTIQYSKTENEGTIEYTVKSLDGTQTLYNGNVMGDLLASHTLSMSGKTLICGEGVSVNLPELDAKNIEFSVGASEATGDFAIQIQKICGQTFKSSIREGKASLNFTYPDIETSIGSTYILPEFKISSVFYPMRQDSLMLTLKDDEGNVIKTVDGLALENVIATPTTPYTVLLEGKSSYKAEFAYKDIDIAIDGNFVITINDFTQPVIQFEDNIDENSLVKVRLGNVHQIRSFTVEDNVSAKDELYTRVVVFNAKNEFIAYNISEIQFNEEGTYKVWVYCQDSRGNVATRYYNVLVESGNEAVETEKKSGCSGSIGETYGTISLILVMIGLAYWGLAVKRGKN